MRDVRVPEGEWLIANRGCDLQCVEITNSLMRCDNIINVFMKISRKETQTNRERERERVCVCVSINTATRQYNLTHPQSTTKT